MIADEQNDKICHLCFGKTKICCDFFRKIKETQKAFETLPKKRKLEPSSLTAEAIKKITRNSGISIKKVKKNVSVEEEPIVVVCSDDEVDDLLEEVPIDSDGSWQDQTVIEEDSDDDYEPDKEKSRKNPSSAAKNREKVLINAKIDFACGFCKESFENFDVLTAHMKAKSCFVEKFECRVCNKEFETKRRLYCHVSATHNKVQTKVLCELCAKEFSSQIALDLHIEATHRRVVKKDCVFRCTICNEKFESHMDLLEHVKIHNKEKHEAPRLCEICSKMCANLRAYKAHLTTHGEKRHVCEVRRIFFGIFKKKITKFGF